MLPPDFGSNRGKGGEALTPPPLPKSVGGVWMPPCPRDFVHGEKGGKGGEAPEDGGGVNPLRPQAPLDPRPPPRRGPGHFDTRGQIWGLRYKEKRSLPRFSIDIAGVGLELPPIECGK